jgi:hypothetical protein
MKLFNFKIRLLLLRSLCFVPTSVMLFLPPQSGWSSSLPTVVPWCTAPANAAPDRLDVLVKRVQPFLGRQPRPMKRLYLAGFLPHQGLHDESVDGVQQLKIMRDAALAWRGGAGPAYHDMAERYLLAWAATYTPTLQPIDETNFDSLIDTYAVLAPDLADHDRTRVREWLRHWGQAYVQDMDGAERRGNHTGGWSNNWQSHRIKLLTMIAVAIGDQPLFSSARHFFQAHVLENISPDGEVTDFAQRDALHYVVYDLEPLLQAALAARSVGEDWYNPGQVPGRSLKQAVAWLQPYVTGERSHMEFVHSTVAFDHKRAAEGLKEFSGPFDPRHAAQLYWIAAAFEPRYTALAKALNPQAPDFLTLCGQ